MTLRSAHTVRQQLWLRSMQIIGYSETVRKDFISEWVVCISLRVFTWETVLLQSLWTSLNRYSLLRKLEPLYFYRAGTNKLCLLVTVKTRVLQECSETPVERTILLQPDLSRYFENVRGNSRKCVLENDCRFQRQVLSLWESIFLCAENILYIYWVYQ